MQLQIEIDQQLLQEAQAIGRFADQQALIEQALRAYIDQHTEQIETRQDISKEMVQEELDKMFLSIGLDLDAEPIPFEVLQKQMRIDLGEFQLSQAIISARDE